MTGCAMRDTDGFVSVPANASASKKRLRKAASSRSEDALFCWVRKENNEGVTISSIVITRHAELLLRDANLLFRNKQKMFLKFSKESLEKFRGCFDLRFRRVNSEAMSADDDATRLDMPRLLQILSAYANADIWNEDEFRRFTGRRPVGRSQKDPYVVQKGKFADLVSRVL